MIADMPVDLWLATEQQGGRDIIVPYVRSAEPFHLHYQIALIRQSQSGTSRIQQSGEVILSAGVAVPLTRLSFSGHADQSCQIAIALKRPDHPFVHYRFNCPQ